jgi:hypothetical protein
MGLAEYSVGAENKENGVVLDRETLTPERLLACLPISKYNPQTGDFEPQIPDESLSLDAASYIVSLREVQLLTFREIAEILLQEPSKELGEMLLNTAKARLRHEAPTGSFEIRS